MDSKLIISLFSHLDDTVMTAEQVGEIALACKRNGATGVHLHMSKFESIDEF